MTLHHYHGTDWKYERRRICDEMPAVTSRIKQWFLWRDDGLQWDGEQWEYVGHFDTLQAAYSYMTDHANQIANDRRTQ